MSEQVENLYIVVGAREETGARYRSALAEKRGNLCLGIDRNLGSSEVYWETRDKGMLRIDWQNTSDEKIDRELEAFIDTHCTALPRQVTLLFASNAPTATAQRVDEKTLKADELALKNLTLKVNSLLEQRARGEQRPVSLNVVALSSAEVTHPGTALAPSYALSKARMESFIRTFVHNPSSPHVKKSGLALRTPLLAAGTSLHHDSDITAEKLVDITLPAICSPEEGNNRIFDIESGAQASPPQAKPREALGFGSIDSSIVGSSLNTLTEMARTGRIGHPHATLLVKSGQALS